MPTIGVWIHLPIEVERSDRIFRLRRGGPCEKADREPIGTAIA